jgi:PrgI family protein
VTAVSRRDDQAPLRARIPADVERQDAVIFGLTWRQLVILAVTALILYAAWTAVATRVHPLVFVAFALPVAGAAFLVAVGRRDGISLDAWLLAALRHRRAPHRLVPTDGPIQPAPAWVATTGGPGNRLPLPGPLRLPARGIGADGLVDLGPDGTVGLVAASTVAFGLRSAGEQNGLVAGFARWLHSLDGPTQILVRAQPVDLGRLAETIVNAAPGLPHPALEQAARSHAAFLAELAAGRQLLHRQVTVAVRSRRGAGRTLHRAAETVRGLAACEVGATVLDAAEAATALESCLNPTATPASGRAAGGLDGGEPA